MKFFNLIGPTVGGAGFLALLYLAGANLPATDFVWLGAGAEVIIAMMFGLLVKSKTGPNLRFKRELEESEQGISAQEMALFLSHGVWNAGQLVPRQREPVESLSARGETRSIPDAIGMAEATSTILHDLRRSSAERAAFLADWKEVHVADDFLIFGRHGESADDQETDWGGGRSLEEALVDILREQQ